MSPFMNVDWQAVLVPSVSPIELMLRGTIMYLAILAAMRVLRREAGALSTADLLVVILVADAAQNGMSTRYESVTEGMILVGTIVCWSYLLDWLGYRYRWIDRLLHAPPLLLISEGRLQRRHMRQEMITPDELKSHLREQGIENVADVKRCYLEPDGRISFVRRDREDEQVPEQPSGGTRGA